MIDIQKLTQELSAIPNGGCNENGVVWDTDGVTEIQSRADVAEIILNHDPNPSIADIKKYLADGVQAYIDARAGERGYSSIVSAVSYLNSSNPQWAAEAEACNAWRDNVWATCFTVMSEVEQGLRGIPSVEELIGLLPELKWS